MENIEDLRSQEEIERDQIKADIKSYVAGLEYSLRLGGKLSEDKEDELYTKANEAGDRLFGKDRENSGVRRSYFEVNAMKNFGNNIATLREGVGTYANNLTRLKTENLLVDPVEGDRLREETIELKDKLIGKGISRVIF